MTERMCLSVLKNEPEVLTVAEVSKILRIGRNKTYALLKEGTLGSIRVGGKIIIPKMCLVRFLVSTECLQGTS